MPESLGFFFNKVAGQTCNFIKKETKRLWHRCFPVNFVKFLKTPFLQNTPGRLFLTETEHLHDSKREAMAVNLVLASIISHYGNY